MPTIPLFRLRSLLCLLTACLCLAAVAARAGVAAGDPAFPGADFRFSDVPRPPEARKPSRTSRAVEYWEQSLLDPQGGLARRVSLAEVEGWRRELHQGAREKRAAWLHVWLGEYRLMVEEQPEQARWHFREARRAVPATEFAYGHAACMDARALLAAGAYREATAAFQRLLNPRTSPPNFDRIPTAFIYRYARACFAMHERNRRLGIRQPARLDPLCGASALAQCLQTLGLPYDRARILGALRVTGLGSTHLDLLRACEKLGVSGHAIAATDEALRRLPKPLIAHVEGDHFVSVLRADAKGLEYG